MFESNPAKIEAQESSAEAMDSAKAETRITSGFSKLWSSWAKSTVFRERESKPPVLVRLGFETCESYSALS